MEKKKVIVFGATGSLGKYIVKALMKVESTDVTLFVRNKAKLTSEAIEHCHVVVGDAMNLDAQHVPYLSPFGRPCGAIRTLLYHSPPR